MRLLQSLTRGLDALDFLKEKGEAVRLTDVAAALEVEKSNASHILKTLVASGYAEQDEHRRYSAAEHIMPQKKETHSLEDIVACKEEWHPVLAGLVAETGECAHLAVLVKDRVWYIDKVDSSLPLKVDHPIGALSPLHCTALGKVFLAYDKSVKNKNFEQFTQTTIITPKDLEVENRQTLARGYAVDNEEFSHGIRCVAHPIFDEAGNVIAAFGVSGPTVRVSDQRFLELGDIVKSAYQAKIKEMNNEP